MLKLEWSQSSMDWRNPSTKSRVLRMSDGIMSNMVTGPFLSMKILQLLKVALPFDYDPIFQQDEAPSHFHVLAREYLNEEFPGRWLGRRWHLAPLDFFLWGYVKLRVFSTKSTTITITDVSATIAWKILTNVRPEFENRLYYCQEVGDSQFEHLMK